MALQRIKLCLSDLVQGGTACRNPQITWEGLGAVEFNCLDSNCNCAELQVPEDAVSKCFNIIVNCQQECDKCPTQVIKRCICDNNDQCGPCEVCIDGQCISRCPDKVCDETRNICVDCTDDNQCVDGKICNAGRCQCPPDKPFEDINGRCVKCQSNGDCPPCTECVDGNCIPKKCGSGECDPNTGDCVDCLSSGNCTKPNQCCKNNKCECCDGFIYNPNTDQCEEIGQCREDEGCPKCYICIDKECLPRVCPTGYTCVDDECKKICECGTGPCSKTEACIPYDGTICFCEKCEGGCDTNANCGYGCFCDDGTCKPNPCGVTTCADATDCSNGCGCNGGLCVPCNSFQCTECDQINGCTCLGNNCASDPCNKPCTNGADCGDGCGCVNGMCTSCSKLSCVGLDCAQALGCDCINNICADVKGCEGPCSITGDCGIGCTCYQGTCSPCVDFTCDDCDNHDGCGCRDGKCEGSGEDPCDLDADIILTKDDANCTLEGKLLLDQCCTCEPIDYIVEQLRISATEFTPTRYKYSIGLYKNGTKLSELPIENEDQYTGQYKLTVTWTNRPYGTVTKFVTVNAGTNPKDTLEFDLVTVPTGAQGQLAVVEISNELTFVNGCVYDKQELGNFPSFVNIGPGASLQERTGSITSSSCRNPIFTWYKSFGTSFLSSEIFRQVYVSPQSQGVYVDILNSSIPEFASNHYYQLEVDCSCAKVTKYTDACGTNPGKLIFCNPDEFTVTGNDCNRSINIAQTNTCEVNHRGEVTWQIFIKTNSVPVFTLFTSVVSVQQGSNYVFPQVNILSDSPVSEVRIRIQGDECEDCTREYVLAPNALCCTDQPTMTLALHCGTTGIRATVLDALSAPIANCSINMYTEESADNLLGTSITNAFGTASFPNLTIGETYWFKFANNGCDPLNCNEIQSIEMNCINCPTKSVTANYNPATQFLNIVLSSITIGNTYTYEVDGVLFTPNPSVLALSNGLHTATVTETFPDGSSCEYTGLFMIDNCGAVIIAVTQTWDDVTQVLEITLISGGTPNYTVSFAGQTFNNITSAGISISTVGLADGGYPLVITDSNGCSSTTNVVIDNCSNFEGNAVVDCNLELITVIFNNGSAPYQYQLQDGGGNTVASGVTNSNSVSVSMDPLAISGNYTLTVQDSQGCQDVDVFPVECLCVPAPYVDITRVFSDAGFDPNEWAITVTLGNFANITFPISITLYEELCENTPTTPFVVIDEVHAAPNGSGEVIMNTFVVTIPPDPSTVSLVITDANGCTVCRNVSLIA